MKGAEYFLKRCRIFPLLAYNESFCSFAGADNNMLCAILRTCVTNGES
jgi:hypothetical protein